MTTSEQAVPIGDGLSVFYPVCFRVYYFYICQDFTTGKFI